MRTRTRCQTVGLMVVAGLVGCAPGQDPVTALSDAIGSGVRKIEDVVSNGRPAGYLYDQKAWKTRDATYGGDLVPIADVRSLVAGSTVILDFIQTKKDPHLDQDMISHRDIPIYIRADGTADSYSWIGRPWTANGNILCIEATDGRVCEDFVQDSTGALFVRSQYLDALAQVVRIVPGDAEHIADV